MMNTWGMLQAIQLRIQQEVLISSASPFDLFGTTVDPGDTFSDYARYGQITTVNPYGDVPNAIFIGHPKDIKQRYKIWCQIMPIDENVYRRAFGGKVWHETPVYVRVASKYTSDWFDTWKLMTQIADVAHFVMAKHAELPNLPMIEAVKEEMKGASMPTGYFFDEMLGNSKGRDYLNVGFCWWHKAQYFIPTGIIP